MVESDALAGLNYLLSARAYKTMFVLENERYKHNQATDIYFFKICKADIYENTCGAYNIIVDVILCVRL